nr:MAG TPA: hypothetical protein [Caudoviricetes sp.]
MIKRWIVKWINRLLLKVYYRGVILISRWS